MLLLAACGDASAPAVDAMAEPDVPGDGSNCFGAGLVRTCLGEPPAAPRSLATAFDTDSADCVVEQGWCLVAATELSVTSLRVTGSRPLVLVATGSITVDGVLDVASRRTATGFELGAAASSPACVPGQTPSAGGGGPGGSFGGRGGNGGAGTLNVAESAFATSITAFRGGCAGLDGDGSPASGGPSGGAVYLLARTQITVTGSINASGAGAGPGGGGGSGGMIGLEAPVVSVSGAVFANGGGGGEGGGAPGANPSNATTPAVGGSGGEGGDGGTGSASTTRTGAAGQSAALGGGGGGGGAGVIVIIPMQVTGGTLSPAPI